MKDLQFLKKLIEDGVIDVNLQQPETGITLLHVIAEEWKKGIVDEELEFVHFLLARVVDLSVRTKKFRHTWV